MTYTFAYSGSKTRQRGQATVELALAVTLFTIIVFATLEFGWVFYNYAYLNNVLTRAIRYGIVLKGPRSTPRELAALVKASRGGLPIQRVTVLMTKGGTTVASPEAGAILTIAGQIKYASITPLSRFVAMSPLGTLTATVSGRIQ